VSAEEINVQGDQEPAKRQKILKKFDNSSMKTVAEQSMSWQTLLGSVMESARRAQQKICTWPHCSFIMTIHQPTPTTTWLLFPILHTRWTYPVISL
jgi:hypothetical protein